MAKSIYQRIVRISRSRKRKLLRTADFLLLLLAAWGAYALRLGQLYAPTTEQALLILAAPVIGVPIFVRFHLYRLVIRYVGEQALWTIISAVSWTALIWTVLAFMTEMTGAAGAPRSVPVLFWLLSIVMVGGLRFGARWLLRLPLREQFARKPALIWGADESGRQLAAALTKGDGLYPVGFIDEDHKLQGGEMAGVQIYAPSRLPWLIEHFGVRDVIVSLADTSAARRNDIVSTLERHMMKVRILPPLSEIARGRYLVNMIREIDVGDLLGRDPVAADPELLRRCVAGKNVLVTGAGGSIGSELCKQIARLSPARLVMLESNEHALYQIDRAIDGQPFATVPVLGSARDAAMAARLIERYAVQTIYHAAAHKHVPLVEANAIEGALNNVCGTKVMADAALEADVETFVLISTDKAVRPTNVMGATKRWAEMVTLEAAERAQAEGRRSCFCAVRFGNVFGSSGSVIPLFKEQIARGGPVTVTHASMTRYFMSIHEAVELVIQAGSLSSGGEIFLLDMGAPVAIIDIARKMIRLAGHTVKEPDVPHGDIEIEITGLRPGEKLFEELLIDASNARRTAHPKILVGLEPRLSNGALTAALTELDTCIVAADEESAQKLLKRIARDESSSAQV